MWNGRIALSPFAVPHPAGAAAPGVAEAARPTAPATAVVDYVSAGWRGHDILHYFQEVGRERGGRFSGNPRFALALPARSVVLLKQGKRAQERQIDLRSDLKAARISDAKSSGSSQAAK